ncbi:MAG: hypothetical protein ABI321_23150 [Polyangia bacterium]
MIPYEELAAALHSKAAPVSPPRAPQPAPKNIPMTTVIDTHHGQAQGLEPLPPPLDDATINGHEDPSAELDIGEVLTDEEL